MNVEIETETPIFLFWEYLFRNLGIFLCSIDYRNSTAASQNARNRLLSLLLYYDKTQENRRIKLAKNVLHTLQSTTFHQTLNRSVSIKIAAAYFGVTRALSEMVKIKNKV
jgi:hypothetical protein